MEAPEGLAQMLPVEVEAVPRGSKMMAKVPGLVEAGAEEQAVLW